MIMLGGAHDNNSRCDDGKNDFVDDGNMTTI